MCAGVFLISWYQDNGFAVSERILCYSGSRLPGQQTNACTIRQQTVKRYPGTTDPGPAVATERAITGGDRLAPGENPQTVSFDNFLTCSSRDACIRSAAPFATKPAAADALAPVASPSNVSPTSAAAPAC